jgi:hypothetical protein
MQGVRAQQAHVEGARCGRDGDREREMAASHLAISPTWPSVPRALGRGAPCARTRDPRTQRQAPPTPILISTRAGSRHVPTHLRRGRHDWMRGWLCLESESWAAGPSVDSHCASAQCGERPAGPSRPRSAELAFFLLHANPSFSALPVNTAIYPGRAHSHLRFGQGRGV